MPQPALPEIYNIRSIIERALEAHGYVVEMAGCSVTPNEEGLADANIICTHPDWGDKRILQVDIATGPDDPECFEPPPQDDN